MTKSPLYRSVNTRARNVQHDTGGDYRHERTRAKRSDLARGSMHPGAHRGRDYTPLFRFLLSKVGTPWDEAEREARARLDDAEPIFWLVARTDAERQPLVRIGEATYYSGLYVDDAGLLQRVDPALTVETLTPHCACCTHTFNGARFTRPYAPAR